MMKSLFSAALCAGLAIGWTAEAENVNDAKVLTFGIVPQQSASRLATMWSPLMAALGKEVGVTVQFRTTKDIPTFEACLASGAYDLAYMNPMHYAIFSNESAYRAIARQSQKRLKGVIVVRADTDVASLDDLGGSRVAFPSPGAFGASILTRSALKNSGVEFEPSYVKSHDSVYRAVAAGLFPAGGGVSRTFNSLDPEIRAQLKVIYETEGFTPHAFAVRSQLGNDLSNRIQSALMNISVAYPELVKDVGMSGFEVGADADWNDVRGLQMEREETGILQAGDVECPSD